MIPVKIAGATTKFTSPKGRDDVSSLWVKVEVFEGTGYCSSRWEPTEEEREIIKNGGNVEIRIMGGQPPISLIAVPQEIDE